MDNIVWYFIGGNVLSIIIGFATQAEMFNDKIKHKKRGVGLWMALIFGIAAMIVGNLITYDIIISGKDNGLWLFCFLTFIPVPLGAGGVYNFITKTTDDPSGYEGSFL